MQIPVLLLSSLVFLAFAFDARPTRAQDPVRAEPVEASPVRTEPEPDADAEATPDAEREPGEEG